MLTWVLIQTWNQHFKIAITKRAHLSICLSVLKKERFIFILHDMAALLQRWKKLKFWRDTAKTDLHYSYNPLMILLKCQIIDTVLPLLSNACVHVWVCVCVCAPYSDRIQGLCYASHTRQLISCSSDGGIVIWNMDVTRQEVREKDEAAVSPNTQAHIHNQSVNCDTLWRKYKKLWTFVKCVVCVFLSVCIQYMYILRYSVLDKPLKRSWHEIRDTHTQSLAFIREACVPSSPSVLGQSPRS